MPSCRSRLSAHRLPQLPYLLLGSEREIARISRFRSFLYVSALAGDSRGARNRKSFRVALRRSYPAPQPSLSKNVVVGTLLQRKIPAPRLVTRQSCPKHRPCRGRADAPLLDVHTYRRAVLPPASNRSLHAVPAICPTPRGREGYETLFHQLPAPEPDGSQ